MFPNVLHEGYVPAYVGYGISDTLSNDKSANNAWKQAVVSYMYHSVMKTDDDGAQYTWTQLKESYKTTIDSELKNFNEEYKEFCESGSTGLSESEEESADADSIDAETEESAES